MPITHSDGAQYFSQTEVDGIVGDRVKNHGAKLTEAEQRASQWEQKYKSAEPQIANASTLAAQVEEWKGKATNAEGGLKRYQAAATHGITDGDTIWALEQAHQRQMGSIEESKRSDFPTWMGAIKADPNLAPSFLRPILAGGQTQQAAPPAAGAPQANGTPVAGGTGAPANAGAPQRPAWAPAVTGQQPVQTGQTQTFSDRIAGAKSMDDLAKIQQERVAARRG